MIKKIILFGMVAVLVLSVGCGKKEEKVQAKSLEAIYKEDGVPVKVMKVEETTFQKHQTYYSEIMPYERTTVYAKIDDRVETVDISAGDYVKKGQMVLEFPETNTNFGIQETKANYELALTTLNRMKELLKSGGISQQEYDNYDTQFKIAKAGLESIADRLIVTAPYNGYITELEVSENDHVFIDGPLFTISDLSKFKSTIWVNETDIDFIREGMEATATWKDYELSGKVATAALTMDMQRRAFKVEVIFTNNEKRFKTGVTAKIDLLLYKKANVISIPTVIIRSIEKNPYIWVAEADKPVKKNVILGQIGSDRIEIINGINAGDSVITEGYHIISENDKLNIIQ